MRTPGEELEALDAAHLRRRLRPVGVELAGRLAREGKSLIPFASNDYLGLADSAELREVFKEAAARYGSGSGASRLITGTRLPHDELEEELADFKGTERALSFSSGYAAAVGTITSVLQRGDVVILDKLCHASLIDGARLSEATIRVFPHNRLDKLEHLLKWAREKVSANGRILVVTESVFSMDGDRADLAAICGLKDQAGALLMVDEAHATGVIGPGGRGLSDECGVSDRVDLQMGTLSKSIGCSGGFICASGDWIDLLINRARSFIYSTAPPPALAVTAAESIRLIRGETGDALRLRLWANIRRLAERLSMTESPESAVVPWQIGESSEALRISAELEDAGFLVPAIRYPTVPRGTARLRISLSATHTGEMIDDLATALQSFASGTRCSEELVSSPTSS